MSQLSPQLLTELEATIKRRHLESVAGEIHSNAAECYAIIADREDDYSGLGNTRFGGEPDLPKDVPWPVDPNSDKPKYSNFVAQINFAELPQLNADVGLPSKGILYPFVRYMESAADPVILDSIYFDGSKRSLARRHSPDLESLCDEYLVNLVPQRTRAVPSISLASFRKKFRQLIDENTHEVDGMDGNLRRIYLESDLNRNGQIGKLLGFANAGDERQNLYRQVVLARLGKRGLVYNDYWDTFKEYEDYIEQWRNDKHLVKTYKAMRNGLKWLTSNRDVIDICINNATVSAKKMEVQNAQCILAASSVILQCR